MNNMYDILGKFRLMEGRTPAKTLSEGFSPSEEVADMIEKSMGGAGRLTSDDLYRAVIEYQSMMDSPHKLDVDEVVQILMDRLHSKGIMVPDVNERVEVFHKQGPGADMERYAKDPKNPAAVASRKSAADAARNLRRGGDLSAKKMGQAVGTDAGGSVKAVSTASQGFKKGSGMVEAKPDFLDLDKDGNTKEPMKKAARDAKVQEAKPEQQRMFGASMEELLKKHGRDVRRFQSSGELSDRLYSALFDYFSEQGSMPYGVAKARTEDPYNWIANKLAQKLGMNEGDLDEVSRGEYIRQQDAKAERSGKKKFKAFGQDFSTDEVKENKDMMSDADRGEYDYEGDMAKDQLRTIEAAAEELKSILSDEENLPEWVQKKITLAAEYVDTARDYMLSKHQERGEEGMMPERKLSKPEMAKREKFVKSMKKSKPDFEKRYGERGEEVMYATATKMAKKKDKKKTKEEVEETTVSGSVAPAAAADTPKKKKGAMQFGKGIYENQLRESFDAQLKNVLNEGMSMNLSVGEDGRKNLTLTATDEDADRLAQIIRLAGMEQSQSFKPACEACGQAECGCEAVSEGDYGNSPETVTASSDMMVNGLSGGLNGPKQQSNPNNPGDNPIAMPRLGQHSSPNLNLGIQKDEKEINEEVERGLRELYKRYRT